MYIDIETNEIISTEQLLAEYESMRSAQPEEYNYSFADYVHNCMTENNGTLERYHS